MHYCPECKYEYERRIAVCPDCNVALVDGESPAEIVSDDAIADSPDENDTTHESVDEAVLLVETQDMLTLRFLIDLLEQEDIPFATRKFTQYGGTVVSDLFTTAQSTASTVGGRDKIFVSPEDFDRAKELWEALQGQELSEADETDEEEESK